MMAKSYWEGWFFILRIFTTFLGALIVGQLIQHAFLYPSVAIVIRDWVASLFQALQFSLIKVNKIEGIGIQFNDYGRIILGDVEVIQPLIGPGCIFFSTFLALATDYFFHHLKRWIEEKILQESITKLGEDYDEYLETYMEVYKNAEFLGVEKRVELMQQLLEAHRKKLMDLFSKYL